MCALLCVVPSEKSGSSGKRKFGMQKLFDIFLRASVDVQTSIRLGSVPDELLKRRAKTRFLHIF